MLFILFLSPATIAHGFSSPLHGMQTRSLILPVIESFTGRKVKTTITTIQPGKELQPPAPSPALLKTPPIILFQGPMTPMTMRAKIPLNCVMTRKLTDRDGDGTLDFQDAFPDDPGEWLDYG